jgi:hypothetical protein
LNDHLAHPVSPAYEGGTPLKLDAFPDVTFPAAALFD